MDEARLAIYIAVFSTVIALGGLILGIINTYWNINKAKVKMIVRPYECVSQQGMYVPAHGEDDSFLTIQIVNKSDYPIFIQIISLTTSNKRKREQFILTNSNLPKLNIEEPLQPRRNICLRVNLTKGNYQSMKNVKFVSVLTQCGITAYGSSNSFRKFIKDIANNS
jgi:hypothetical protein